MAGSVTPSKARELSPLDSTSTTEITQLRRGVTALRIGIGLIWSLNLLFVLDPQNQFFPGFSATASSFGSMTLGGPELANFAAANASWMAFVVAGVTAYLAFAFLAGFSTRIACLIGAGFNVALLLTQFGSIVVIPGGTDVGPQPIYLLIYAVLLIAHAERYLSVDSWGRSWARGWRTSLRRVRPARGGYREPVTPSATPRAEGQASSVESGTARS
ncbi:MAG: hypothetical protein WAN87_07000 [Thermoplasmata archaeon]